ncbi:tRNA-uridine aminocarboxypropyltransferase 1-like [Symsagittifera roscoffensis]|uniref:tRNA-uridine aminocarboxypropyltransferase 1-like n=1 Tax=Symsagittifera roscoffensis TaxID=84072 RepID=UPI00307BCDE0
MDMTGENIIKRKKYDFEVQISDQACLNIADRGNCLSCGRSRKWFCYDCARWSSGFDGKKVPRVSLPFPLHILKHNIEVSGKSTALHAVMLVNSPCKYHVYPRIPDYSKMARPDSENPNIWVLYPSKTAKPVREIVEDFHLNCSAENSSYSFEEFCKIIELDLLVVVDGTWTQIHDFLDDFRIKSAKSVRFVKLVEIYETTFWRPQGKLPKSYLATIEALFYFMKELQLEFAKFTAAKCLSNEDEHKFDNLLFFYDFMLKCVTGRGSNPLASSPKDSS